MDSHGSAAVPPYETGSASTKAPGGAVASLTATHAGLLESAVTATPPGGTLRESPPAMRRTDSAAGIDVIVLPSTRTAMKAVSCAISSTAVAVAVACTVTVGELTAS